MTSATYSADIFNVNTMREARQIILTDEETFTTEQRWERETPHLIDIMGRLALTPDSLVLDFGCGAGRLAKGLINRYGCRVIGVDTSPNMRVFAQHYVRSERFMVGDLFMVEALGVKFDAALAVWVLQHAALPEIELERIHGLLKPVEGQFFVVNEKGRVVPTKELGWVDDGKDVKALLGNTFTLKEEGKLAPAVVGEKQSERTYWARYSKGG